MLYCPISYQLRILLCLVFSSLLFLASQLTGKNTSKFFLSSPKAPPLHSSAIIAKCHRLQMQAGPPQDFHIRTHSDRFEEGTRPVLVKNAKIWTGGKNGTEVIQGDILMDNGIIKNIGYVQSRSLELYGKRLMVLDAKGAWITPGIVDIHSHIGNEPSPVLSGTQDDNSWKGTMQPWLRSLDALNTHDDSYLLSIAGGVTTSLVLPGSANAIGKFSEILVFFENNSIQVARHLLSNFARRQNDHLHPCCLNHLITSILHFQIQSYRRNGVISSSYHFLLSSA